MGLFDDLFGKDKKKSQQAYGLFSFLNQEKDKESEFSEKEMDDYGLEDWQKEEVKKGNYNPWDFDEDDTSDEDNYYHEDDD